MVYRSILRFINEEWAAKPQIVRDFLNSNFLGIPDYQRPYSWKSDHVSSLLNDIQNVSRNVDNQWYLGAFYTTGNGIDDRNMLLDGQQRFTTIFVILLAICKKLIENGVNNEDCQEVNDDFLQKYTPLFYNSPGDKCTLALNDVYNMPWKALMKVAVRSTECNEVKLSKLCSSIQDFNSKALDFEINGQSSLINIYNNLNLVIAYLNENFDGDSVNTNNRILEFGDNLLNKLWFIEIPLTKDEKSIPIFESLNNRGKSLTLSDKLNFLFLTKTQFEGNKTVVRNNFYNIIKCIEELTLNSLIKDEDTFWKYYLMSDKAISITRESDTLRGFNDIISGTVDFENEDQELENSKVIKLQNEIIDTLKSILFLSKNLDEDYLNKLRNPKEKTAVVGIMNTLNRALFYRDFNMVLVMCLVKKFSLYTADSTRNVNYNLITGALNIIRFNVCFPLLSGLRSNNFRNAILQKVKSANFLDWTQWVSYVKNVNVGGSMEEQLVEVSLNSRVFVTDDIEENLFILYAFSLINNPAEINSAIGYEHETIEHFMPRKYKSHWDEYCFTLDCLKSACELYYIEGTTPVNSTEKHLYDFVMNTELKLATKNELESKSVGVELTGNKIVVDKNTNSAANNYSLKRKVKVYEGNTYLHPTRWDDYNFINNSITNWSAKEIIGRTIAIYSSLRKYQTSYTQLNDIVQEI